MKVLISSSIIELEIPTYMYNGGMVIITPIVLYISRSFIITSQLLMKIMGMFRMIIVYV